MNTYFFLFYLRLIENSWIAPFRDDFVRERETASVHEMYDRWLSLEGLCKERVSLRLPNSFIFLVIWS